MAKRSFYEDDENVTPMPGTVVPASASEIESLGPNKLVDGISVRSPAFLENYFHNTRKSVVSLIQSVENTAEKSTNDYYNLEHKFTGTVADLHNKRESLLPGGLYIITGVLTGSIITRRRGLFARFSVPLILGLTAFKLSLPLTFANTVGFTYKLEKQAAPNIVETQDQLVENVDKSLKSVEETASKTIKKVDGLIDESKRYVASITGLNLDEDVVTKK